MSVLGPRRFPVKTGRERALGRASNVRKVHREGQEGPVSCPLRGQPDGEQGHRLRAPAPRPDQGRRRPRPRSVRPLRCQPRVAARRAGGARSERREAGRAYRDPLQRRNQEDSCLRRGGGGAAPAPVRQRRTHPPGSAARRGLRGGPYAGGEGDASVRAARGHRGGLEAARPAEEGEGDAVPQRVLARSVGDGGTPGLRPAHRTRERAAADDSGPVAPAQEQHRAPGRAGRRQDGAGRGPGAAHRRGQRAGLPVAEAHSRPRPVSHRRRHQVPRPVRGAPERDHLRDYRERGHHHLHR